MKFSGVVLMGGNSTRMGTDKAFVTVDGGRVLAAVAVEALRDAGASEILAVGGDGERLRTTVADAPIRVVEDRWPGEGPLGGITTALAAATHPIVVVLACDLPRVTAAAVRAVLEGVEFGADAAVPVDGGGRRHVLLAAYRRTCRTIFEVAMATGVRAPKDVLDGLDVAVVKLADPRWADNANTPGDLSTP